MRAEPGSVFASVDEAEHRVVVVTGAVQFVHVNIKSPCVRLSPQQAQIKLADSIIPRIIWMRCALRHGQSLGLHESRLLVQLLKTIESGSRLRKSTYCCQTKNALFSIGFVVVGSEPVKSSRLGVPEGSPLS
jgi:hypothetical protein